MYVLKNSFHFLSLINKQFKKIVIKNYDNYIFAVDKYFQFEYNMNVRRRSNGLLSVLAKISRKIFNLNSR